MYKKEFSMSKVQNCRKEVKWVQRQKITKKLHSKLRCNSTKLIRNLHKLTKLSKKGH